MSTNIIKNYPVLFKKDKSGKVRVWKLNAIVKNDDNSFGKRINETYKNTGKDISVDILRHSYISEILGKSPFPNDKKIKMIAKAMGHKPSTHISYRKLEPNKRIDAFLEDGKREVENATKKTQRNVPPPKNKIIRKNEKVVPKRPSAKRSPRSGNTRQNTVTIRKFL